MEALIEKIAEGLPDGKERRTHLRYDANCPAIVELNFADGLRYIALTGFLVNISIKGCLVSSEKLPWKDVDIEKVKSTIFEIIMERCRVYMPWSNTHCTGAIRRVGAFTIGLEFEMALPEDLVSRISELEPNQRLRFEPRNRWKYNRVLLR